MLVNTINKMQPFLMPIHFTKHVLVFAKCFYFNQLSTWNAINLRHFNLTHEPTDKIVIY